MAVLLLMVLLLIVSVYAGLPTVSDLAEGFNKLTTLFFQRCNANPADKDTYLKELLPSISNVEETFPYVLAEDRARLAEGLRKAGLPM